MYLIVCMCYVYGIGLHQLQTIAWIVLNFIFEHIRQLQMMALESHIHIAGWNDGDFCDMSGIGLHEL